VRWSLAVLVTKAVQYVKVHLSNAPLHKLSKHYSFGQSSAMRAAHCLLCLNVNYEEIVIMQHYQMGRDVRIEVIFVDGGSTDGHLMNYRVCTPIILVQCISFVSE
jgi:hypothetical protein